MKHVALSFLLLTLYGCSNLQTTDTPPPPSASSWTEHQSAVALIHSWQLNGKIGITRAQDSQSASLAWQQEQDTYQIDIRGPWGQGGASIYGSSENVRVETSDGETYQANSAETLLEEQLGWALPISDIYWWIRGMPSPSTPAKYTLNNNRLDQLSQNGWAISYLRYNHLTPALPQKLKLSHDAMKITLIIHQWQPKQ